MERYEVRADLGKVGIYMYYLGKKSDPTEPGVVGPALDCRAVAKTPLRDGPWNIEE